MKKILFIQTAFLGDAILTLPLIQKLKEANSDSEITVLCIPSTKDVFLNSPSVANVIVYDKRGADKSYLSYLKLIMKVRSQEFDLVISSHRSIRSTVMAFLSGAGETVGFTTADLFFLYKKRIEYRKDRHEVERNLSLVSEEAELTSWKILPEIQIPEEAKGKIEALVAPILGSGIIAVAPGSVWKTKVYPSRYYEELIKMILSLGYNVALIGGKEDTELCETIAKNVDRQIVSLAGKLSIVESVSFLKKCVAVVCNDSAPTHLAMAADIPALTIYCSTIAGFGFYPYNKTSAYISFDDLECKPCGIHGYQTCPVKTFDCAFKLKPEIVFEKLRQILPA